MKTPTAAFVIVFVTLSYSLAQEWPNGSSKNTFDALWGPGVDPSEYFSKKSQVLLKAGSYEENTLGTKVRLNYLAFADPEKLKNVNLVYSYELSILCKTGMTIPNVVFVAGDSRGKTVKISDDLFAAKSFSCDETDQPDNSLAGVYVFSPNKVPTLGGTQFISLKAGESITPDSGAVTIDHAGIVVVMTGAMLETLSTGDFVKSLKAASKK